MCGHGVGKHSTGGGVDAPPAATGELRKCEICASRKGACRKPGEDGHLAWTEAYCPKCFTKANPKGCKQLDSDGHWTTAAATSAMAAAMAALEVVEEPKVCPPCKVAEEPKEAATSADASAAPAADAPDATEPPASIS